MYKYLLIASIAFLFMKGQAQEVQLSKELITDEPLNNLIQGRLYVPSYHYIKGEHLLYEYWKLGSVVHLGRAYNDIPLWYDLYIDDVILLDWQNQGFGYSRLVKNNIEGFTLNNRTFINLGHSKYSNTDLKEGYYEVLTEGYISILARRTVVKKEDNYVPFFERDDKVFVIKNNQGILLKNKKSLFNILNDNEKKLTDNFIDDHSIKIRKATEEDWINIVHHINGFIQ